MNFKDFKSLVDDESSGGYSYSSDDAFRLAVYEKLKTFAREIKPMMLLTTDVREEYLTSYDDGFFIRVPNAIDDDNSLIDIDDSLCMALVYMVSLKYATDANKPLINQNLKEIRNNYRWERFNLEEKLKESCHE